MKLLFPLLALLGGAAVAFQVQINGGLGKGTGVLEAFLHLIRCRYTCIIFYCFIFW